MPDLWEVDDEVGDLQQRIASAHVRAARLGRRVEPAAVEVGGVADARFERRRRGTFGDGVSAARREAAAGRRVQQRRRLARNLGQPLRARPRPSRAIRT
jgi:hypothetical protein